MEEHSSDQFLRLCNSMEGHLRTDTALGLSGMVWKEMGGHNWVQFLHWCNSTVVLHHLDTLLELGQESVLLVRCNLDPVLHLCNNMEDFLHLDILVEWLVLMELHSSALDLRWCSNMEERLHRDKKLEL